MHVPRISHRIKGLSLWVVLLAGAMVPSGMLAQQIEIPSNLRAALSQLLRGMTPDEVVPASVEGFYRISVGTEVVYLSADGRYLLRGDVIDLQTGRNLTESKRQSARRAAIEALGESSMIVFTPTRVRHSITVFTDVDCGFCARLHSQMADYHRLGVEVRYVAFPRAGIPSKSYDKTVSVWCSDDPHRAIGDAKFGRPVPARACDNPVKDHYVAGRLLGVNGTPTIVLEDGEVLPGYVAPDNLIKHLERKPDQG